LKYTKPIIDLMDKKSRVFGIMQWL